jgi:hypothetical protein
MALCLWQSYAKSPGSKAWSLQEALRAVMSFYHQGFNSKGLAESAYHTCDTDQLCYFVCFFVT